LLLDTQRYLRPTPSESALLAYVIRQGRASQPAIAAATGLSQQSVSRLVSDLVARGALRYGPRLSSGRRGQPSQQVEATPSYAYSLGMSLMTDAIALVLMDFAGQVVDSRFERMPAMTRTAVFAAVQGAKADMLAKHKIDPARLFGLGVGLSGYCLDGMSRFNAVHALDEFAMVSLDQLFADALGLPTWVENDGNAAAIGESLLGVGRTHANFVYIFIAAGVGGGVVINNKLWRGANGNAGEVALILPRNIYQHPSLETLRQCLLRHGVNIDTITDLVERFDPQWPGVDEWIERVRDSMSLMVSAVAATVDPDAVVLGGRIPKTLAQMLIPHIEIYDNTRRAEPRPFPKILLSQTQADACAIGAASMAFKRYFLLPETER
jgi:predicted NBD/HSP70 family sugar kinase